jgi:hypothetical protein
MVRFGKSRFRLQGRWIAVAIAIPLVIFGGLLAANVAAQAYERQVYFSPNYTPLSSSTFPASFLGGSLKDKSGCGGSLLRQGDGTF